MSFVVSLVSCFVASLVLKRLKSSVVVTTREQLPPPPLQLNLQLMQR